MPCQLASFVRVFASQSNRPISYASHRQDRGGSVELAPVPILTTQSQLAVLGVTNGAHGTCARNWSMRHFAPEIPVKMSVAKVVDHPTGCK